MSQDSASAIQISAQTLAAAYACKLDRAALWVPHINAAMVHAQIYTSKRAACWLAQLGHESGRLRYVREIWGPTSQQLRYERAQGAHWPTGPDDAKTAKSSANRLAFGLGNVNAGDGKRYMGRGLIQVTGRANYRAATVRLRAMLKRDDVPDFEATPGLLEVPQWAALSAAAYWRARGLNDLADRGLFSELTRRINGGLNGLADRQALYTQALMALRAQATQEEEAA